MLIGLNSSENNTEEKEWIKWAIIAVKSVYGFDWQGDNVLLARENLLYKFIDYYYNKFNKKPEIQLVKDIAYILIWNIWQMDGIKFVILNSCKNKKITEITLFGEITTELIFEGCKSNNHNYIINYKSKRYRVNGKNL